MEIAFPLASNLVLRFIPVTENRPGYPSSQIQKGLILIQNDQDLTEEAVGFGVPVLKFGTHTIFPGSVEWIDFTESRELRLVYRLNLQERLSAPNLRSVDSRLFYRIKNSMADLYRRHPVTRPPLIALSNALRGVFGWQTTYEKAVCDYPLQVCYGIDSQSREIQVTLDSSEASSEGLTEVVIMNELGAHAFDTYTEPNGACLVGEKIGSWEEVTSERAAFLSRRQQLAFSLPRIPGARLFRGRELVGERLAWAGFGYSIPPTTQHFAYSLKIERFV